VTKYVESEEQRAKRRIRDRIRAAKKRAAMTPEQRKATYAANAEYQRRRRKQMSLEDRRKLRRELWLRYHGESYRKRAADYQREKRRSDERYAIATSAFFKERLLFSHVTLPLWGYDPHAQSMWAWAWNWLKQDPEFSHFASCLTKHPAV
jgi:hypothetical protein